MCWVATLMAGLANWGWLNVLKNSARNSNVAPSLIPPTVVVLANDMSQLL